MLKNIKSILIIGLASLVSHPSWATPDLPKEEKLAQVKSVLKANHERRIEILKQGLICIDKAQSPDELRNCRVKEEEAHAAIKKDAEFQKQYLKGVYTHQN